MTHGSTRILDLWSFIYRSKVNIFIERISKIHWFSSYEIQLRSIELSIMKVVRLMLVPMSVQSTQCEYYGHRHITGSRGRGATEFPLELLLTNQSSSRRTNRRRKNFQLLKYFQTLNNGDRAGNSWNNSFVGGWGWNLEGWRLHHAWDQQSENNSSIR